MWDLMARVLDLFLSFYFTLCVCAMLTVAYSAFVKQGDTSGPGCSKFR